MSAIRAPRLDGVEQIARRNLAEALPFAQGRLLLAVAFAQGEDVGGRADEAFRVEELDLLVAQPFDIEGVARAEMLQALDRLRRAHQMAGAAAHGVHLSGLLVDLAQGRRAADRAHVGENELRPSLVRCVAHDFEDLRDHVARALHDDRVADAHVLARDLVLVVERRVRDHDAADRDGLELRDRSERAGPPDLDLDPFKHGRGALGRKFVRQRPARRPGDEAEAGLQGEVVDLVDDAVDVIAERCALLLDLAVMREHLVRRAAEPGQRIGRQAEAMQRVDGLELGRGDRLADRAPGIGEKRERPRRR